MTLKAKDDRSQPIRVLHVLNEIRYSGAETMLHSAASVWTELDLHALSTGATRGPFAEQLKSTGYELHHVPFRKTPGFAFAFRRTIKNIRPDILHIHTERSFLLYALIAATVRPRPQVVRTIHHIFRFQSWLRVRKSLERRLGLVIGVRQICNSESGRRAEFETYGLFRPVVPNWYNSDIFCPTTQEGRVEARRRLGIPIDRKLIVSVGSNTFYKNLECVVEAISQIRENFAVQYIHVGTEGISLPLSRRATQCQIEEHVTITGNVASVVDYLHAADVFVMPSTEEGFGIAAVEAMACGVPAVLSNCEGLRDFADAIPGIVYVEPTPSSLAGGVVEVLGWNDIRRTTTTSTQSESVKSNFGLARGPMDYLKMFRLLAS